MVWPCCWWSWITQLLVSGGHRQLRGSQAAERKIHIFPPGAAPLVRALLQSSQPLISRIDPAPARNPGFDIWPALCPWVWPTPPYPYLNPRDCYSREIGDPPSGPIAISPFHRIWVEPNSQNRQYLTPLSKQATDGEFLPHGLVITSRPKQERKVTSEEHQ